MGGPPLGRVLARLHLFTPSDQAVRDERRSQIGCGGTPAGCDPPCEEVAGVPGLAERSRAFAKEARSPIL